MLIITYKVTTRSLSNLPFDNSKALGRGDLDTDRSCANRADINLCERSSKFRIGKQAPWVLLEERSEPRCLVNIPQIIKIFLHLSHPTVLRRVIPFKLKSTEKYRQQELMIRRLPAYFLPHLQPLHRHFGPDRGYFQGGQHRFIFHRFVIDFSFPINILFGGKALQDFARQDRNAGLQTAVIRVSEGEGSES